MVFMSSVPEAVLKSANPISQVATHWMNLDSCCMSCLGFSRVVEGNGNPLQYSCLENPMDRGA